jgi:hypothetical protein
MGMFRRFTLRTKLLEASRKGLGFVERSAQIYSLLLENKPDQFKLFDGICQYTAGWACGSVLSYMVAFAGRPETPDEEEMYDGIAFDSVEQICKSSEYLGYMRGLTADDARGIRVSPEFDRGYRDAWRETVRLLSGDTAMFFPIGFKGYRPEDPSK